MNTETPATPLAGSIEASMFWAEIAPCEHLLQIYNEDGAILDLA